MSDYAKLVEDLKRGFGHWYVEDWSRLVSMYADAAAAIEALQAEVEELKAKKMKLAENSLRFVGKVRELDKRRLEPKRGEWELIDGAEPMRWGCSRCKYLSWETSNYCPRCGAKMEVQE